MMAEKKNTPEVRYKGFTNAWEFLELGSIAAFNPKSELPDTFEYVDLESVVGTQMIAHRPERRITAPSRAQRLARKGDLFYQTVRPYQKNNYLFEFPYDNYVFSTGYAQMRPYGHGYFLLSLVQNNWFVKSVLDNCTGTSYPAINSTDLAEIKISIPAENNEQSKIGNYFQKLDKLIKLHQQKYDKLVNIKKAMLEKMFPQNGADVPEIRFKGFDGAWEEKTLDHFGNATSGTSIESEFLSIGDFKVISIGSYSEQSTYTDQFIRANLTEKTKKRILNINDLTMVLNDKTASGNIIGRVLLIDEADSFVYNQRTQRIEPFHDKYDSQFLYQLLNAPLIRSRIIKQSQGNTQIYVNWSAIKEIVYLVPKIKEQQKIGSYFKKIDKLIILHKSELEKLKRIKKACSEKMFV